MITLGDIKTEFTNFLANEGVSSRINNWIYWVMVDILKTPHKFWWNKRVGDFLTEESTAEYYIPYDIYGKDILWMGDENREGVEIKETKVENIYRFDSTPDDEGEPEYWALVGLFNVADFNEASTVSIVSNDNDDQAINVVVRGRITGFDRYEKISLTGTSTATGAITWPASSIVSVSLESATQGQITVTTGSTTISRLSIGQLKIECPKIRLWRVPAEASTLPFIYYRKPTRPSDNSETIEIPDAGIPCLLKGIEYWGHLNNGDVDFARSAYGEYQEFKRDLISWSQTELNQVDRKNWNRSFSGVPYTLPRVIDATIDGQ